MNVYDWHECVVFSPKKTIGGRTLIFCKAERRWNDDLNWWCSNTGFSGSDGGWEYRLPCMGKDDTRTYLMAMSLRYKWPYL